MGGHAFHHLHCPRISRDVYLKVREQTSASLGQLFAHVVVPIELPSKQDYGDIDFLVSTPLYATPATPLDWTTMVKKIKFAFDTPHGRRGHLNPSCMYFAIRASGYKHQGSDSKEDDSEDEGEEEIWVQVDVKVCEDAALFSWQQFQLNYASAAKMLGSLVKPLGLTISPVGLHMRVEELETTNMAGSMVFLTNDANEVLKIAGLDRRLLSGGFEENDELYEYLSSSWLFNPAHFAQRLKSDKYADHLEDRSAPWVHFVTEWIPEHYPGYCLPSAAATPEEPDLQTWYSSTRVFLREKAFTAFPSAAVLYYQKRRTCLREIEEQRLRRLLMSVLPSDHQGWTDDIPPPPIIITIKPTLPPSPALAPQESPTPLTFSVDTGLPTPPPSPNPSSAHHHPLSRSPPAGREYIPSPPPSNMSPEARLLCLARWTLFHPLTRTPYLAREPRGKKSIVYWANSQASDEVLVEWAKGMWWIVWARQSYVNWVGQWRSRFRKEDEKAARKVVRVEEGGEGEEEKVAKRAEAKGTREKILGRLVVLNERMHKLGVMCV
ncbi:hypothetical protein K504DRAFT_427354 [Pleomassaria siparia CBS 279.74]|uniref:Uncharacterized protein n=1 Tax=Pleomassaria siparia CBS 279.74 TaxID=1314801 RepID=A0A6G1KIV0_9PLEO|nr:hypothetical protein K504DRAFT_427354 [Pleomassaria siparia CBS 279.74]